MQNNVKNALNALALLGFMALAWATSQRSKHRPTQMTVAINADSTAFVLTNLENKDFNDGEVIIDTKKKRNVFILDTLPTNYFSAKRIAIKANESIILPFKEFKGYKSDNTRIILSKSVNIEGFMFNNYLSNEGGARIYASFYFKFKPKPNGSAP